MWWYDSIRFNRSEYCDLRGSACMYEMLCLDKIWIFVYREGKSIVYFQIYLYSVPPYKIYQIKVFNFTNYLCVCVRGLTFPPWSTFTTFATIPQKVRNTFSIQYTVILNPLRKTISSYTIRHDADTGVNLMHIVKIRCHDLGGGGGVIRFAPIVVAKLEGTCNIFIWYKYTITTFLCSISTCT